MVRRNDLKDVASLRKRVASAGTREVNLVSSLSGTSSQITRATTELC